MNTDQKATIWYANPATGSLYSMAVTATRPGYMREVVADLTKRWMLVSIIWR